MREGVRERERVRERNQRMGEGAVRADPRAHVFAECPLKTLGK